MVVEEVKKMVKIMKLTPTATTPKLALELDNGYDIWADVMYLDHYNTKQYKYSNCLFYTDRDFGIITSVQILPGGLIQIPLGFSAEFDSSFGAFIMDKSGIGLKGLKYLGGVIEGTYRGEWSVVLVNVSNRPVEIKSQQKICQVVFMPVLRPKIVEVKELTETERGSGGFGHTGV